MQSLSGICCPICLGYLLKPITTVCGHSFCQMCLDEYMLLLSFCPICQKQIRNNKTCFSNTLAEFVENFVENEDSQEYPEYKDRMNKLKLWKKAKDYGMYKVGMKIDIRDQNYIWCEGIIVRIISRVGQNFKILKIKNLVRYCYKQDINQEQQLKTNSNRLAFYGFYTSRNDIPRYKQLQSR